MMSLNVTCDKTSCLKLVIYCNQLLIINKLQSKSETSPITAHSQSIYMTAKHTYVIKCYFTHACMPNVKFFKTTATTQHKTPLLCNNRLSSSRHTPSHFSAIVLYGQNGIKKETKVFYHLHKAMRDKKLLFLLRDRF